MNQKITDYWGLYDFPMRLMNSEQLDDLFTTRKVRHGEGNLVPPRFPMTVASKYYFKARAKDERGTTVYTVQSRWIDATYGYSRREGFVKGEATSVTNFQNDMQNFLKALSAKAADDQPRADLSLSISIQSPLCSRPI